MQLKCLQFIVVVLLSSSLSLSWADDAIWSLEQPSSLRSMQAPKGQVAEWPSELVYSLKLNHSAIHGRSTWQIPLPSGRSMSTNTQWQPGQNGTQWAKTTAIRDFRSRAENQVWGHGLLTTSDVGMFGELRTSEGLFKIFTDHSGTWMVRLDDARVDLGHQCGLGHPSVGAMSALGQHLDRFIPKPSGSSPRSGDIRTIDVLMLYTQDMADRYPGELIETRFAHIINVANQAIANTEINDIVVRLVGTKELTTYEPHPQSLTHISDAVSDLVNALTLTDPNESPEVSLAALRRQTGADIVSLFKTADVERDGACGQSVFPDGDPNNGVNVNADGISNWSVCGDQVFAHELGHNFNMRHQYVSSVDPSIYDPTKEHYAMTEPAVFSTIMRTYSSYDINRYLVMPAYSNPEMSCAGQPCGKFAGESAGANNRQSLLDYIDMVSGYEEAVDQTMVTPLAKANPDSDGDGTSDWEDPTPFGEWDGPVEGTYENPRPIPGQDRGGFDLLVSSQDNTIRGWRLGATGGATALGVVIQVPPPSFPDLRPGLNEHSSIVVGNDGLLFALSGGDIKTYSRQTGQEISTFRGRNYSRDSDDLLRALFPRAMAISGDGSVLGILGATGMFRETPYTLRSVYDPRDGTIDGKTTYDGLGDVENGVGAARDLVFSEDAEMLATVSLLPDVYVHRYTALLDSGSPPTYIYLDSLDFTVADSPRALAMIPIDASEWAFYVADESSNRIYRLATNVTEGVDPQILLDGPTLSGLLTPMTRIRDIEFGPDGDLYVLDQGSQAIARFDADGTFIEYVVGPEASELAQAERMTFARGLLPSTIFSDQFSSQGE